MTGRSDPQISEHPPCPLWLLIGTYLLYLGLATTDSVPLFGKIDWMHEGERVGSVQIVLDGGVPIRDVYLPHGLFPEVIRPLFAFWLFGESLAADRIIGMLIEPLTYVAAAFYVWKVFPTQAGRLAGLLGFALYPLLLWPRHIPVFLALGLLTAWVHGRRQRHLWWAGIITGLGYVIGTVDQTTLLLATVLVFPFAVLALRVMHQRAGTGRDPLDVGSTRSLFLEMACPLFGGILIGLIPFLSYLGLTGTAGLFLVDFVRRAEADAAFSHVWLHQSYPSLSPTTLIWYVVPAFYAVLATAIIVRVVRDGGRYWIPIVPTLLFGILSFTYAIRAFTYWKLAVVVFPFIVSFVHLLYVVTIRQQDQPASRNGTGIRSGEKILLALSGCALIALLVYSLTREWSVKQIAPRILFPGLTLLALGVTVAAAIGLFRSRPWRRGVIIASPLAILLIASWFLNDVHPQVLSAQIKKPRLVGDVVRLVQVMARADGRLTRVNPPYVEDETLTYLRTASLEDKRVVMLSPGAGIYYFLARLSPPNRFPEINIALADRWAQEVVEGLDRTMAELLVACDDHGRRMGGWPIRPVLSGFIAANYVDSGRRLHSQMLGDCPFSVWVHRKTRNGMPAEDHGRGPA